MMKGWQMKVCWWKIGRELILIILMFSLISQPSLSSSNVGDSSLRFVSVFLLSTPTRWNFEISMTSLYPNTSSIQYMSKIWWAFCLLFSLALLQASFEFLILFLRCNKFFISPTLFVFSSIPYFITSSWLKAANVFFSRINKCVSLHRRI